MVDTGLVSKEQIQEVLEAGGDGKRLAPVLIESGFVGAAKLAQMLSYQLCLPWVSLDHVRFSPKLLRLIPVELAVKYGVVPVHMRRRNSDGRMTLYVATDDPTSEEALEACKRAAGMPVRMMVATPTDVTKALAEEYGEGEVSPADDALADTAPDGTALDAPKAAPRSLPDTDVAAAAARMSSPDLSDVPQVPLAAVTLSNERAGGMSPPAPRVVAGPSASSPPPPRAAAAASPIPREVSPAPGLTPGVPNVTPRIVEAHSGRAGDDEIEEIDDLDVEDEAAEALFSSEPVPETTPSPKDHEVREKPLARVTEPVSGEEIDTLPRGRKAPSDTSALFDSSSWEAPHKETTPGALPLPPPPAFLFSQSLASAPPPPGAVPPPPPPPPPPMPVADSILPEDIDVELQEGAPEELSPEPDEVQPLPTPRSVQEEGVVLVVGADEDFIRKCHRALFLLPVRMVSCALMSASSRAKDVKPFVIVVPEDVYGFDRFAFHRLALASGCPLLIWEREFEPEQVSALIELAHGKSRDDTP